mmetsp:Transcript_2147/g.4393  ORF Transcript_2147/g.4393 Transcript_2147/m.4393 type:complete len:900 (+) Transcript_2147:148-2847(+)
MTPASLKTSALETGTGGGTVLGPRLVARKALAGYILACAICAVFFLAGGELRNLIGGDGGRGAEGRVWDTNFAVRYGPASPEDCATIVPPAPRGDYYPAAFDPRAYASADGADASCDDVLLFIPSSNVRTVEGQLGSYLVAALAATFADHALVILDDPADDLFGTGRAGSSGGGLASLIDHPDELSRRCPVPCAGTFGYDDWEARSWPGPVTPVLCSESTQNVLVINGDTAEAYLATLTADMSHRSTGEAVSAAFRWATRLGARADEAAVLSTMTDGKQILDYACGLLARSGLLRLSPEVAKDVASFLWKDGKDGRGAQQWDAFVMTDDRIPLDSYLSRLTDECRHHEVYVATNSTDRMREQIAGLPRHKEGWERGCATFTFSVVHGTDPAWSLYQNTVIALSRLVVLARSQRLVADPGSDRHMYALLRFFRRRIRGSHDVMRSRSVGDGGGGEEGSTFIEGLEAVAEGEAGEVEIYAVYPRSKYGEVQTWSGIGDDSLYGNGKEVEGGLRGGLPTWLPSSFDKTREENDSPAILPGLARTWSRFFNRPNDVTPPPIVFIGLNYEMGNGASAKIIPFLCHKNERIIILTNTAQPAAESGSLGQCVETVNIADTYERSVSEMPYDTRIDGFKEVQKVFYDRWYVLRDWMRATNTEWVFTMDSDTIMTLNMADFFRDNFEVLSQRKYWVAYEPPRSTFAESLLTLDFLNDVTSFWNILHRLEEPRFWSEQDNKDMHLSRSGYNDMLSLGHYIHLSEGPGMEKCWGWEDESSREPSSCSTGYGYKPILERLRLHGVQARYKPGSFLFNETQHSEISDAIGVADKNYMHDPMNFFEMKGGGRGQKQLRFDYGKPQMLLKNGSWYPIWAYILEDGMERCVDSHLERILQQRTCTCTDFCCNSCQ